MRKSNPFSQEMLLFVVIFCGAIVARFWNLGEFGLFTDELYHVIGAQAILEVGRPVFPSGDEYTRALGFTYLTALSFKLFGVSEFSARLPAVLLNLIFILVSFEIVRRLFNTRVALIYLVVMSFSPFMLKMARQCRMYTGLQLSFALAAFSFYHGFENGPGRAQGAFSRIEKKYDVRVGYLFISLALLSVAYHLHPLAVNFGIIVLVYALAMAVLLWQQQGLRAAVGSKYFLVLAIFGIISLIAILVRGDLVAELLRRAREVPVWDRHRQAAWHYYRYFLEGDYPFLFFLYPISAAFLVEKRKKLGIFIVAVFGSLIFVHTFLFEWKLHRYIFYFFPFFVLAVAFFMDGISKTIFEFLKMEFRKKGFLAKIYLPLASVFAFYLFFYPWLNNSKGVLSQAPWSDWRQFYNRTGQYLDKKKAIISTSQNSIFYYFGEKPTYYLRATFFESPGDAEYFSGSPPVVNLEQLKEVCATNTSLYFVSENNLFNSPAYLTNEMREYILDEFQEIPLSYATPIRIFRKIQEENEAM